MELIMARNTGVRSDSAGDINNDGYDDIVVGSPVYPVNGNPSGTAFVFLGGPSGLSSAPYAELTTSDKGSLFAYSVAGAGDVDNNGYDDIIVGAPSHHEDYQGAGENGAAYLFLGSASGFSLSPAWTFIGADDTQFGASVAGAGDVNGDGYADVLIGATQYTQPQVNEGAAYLFLGSASGLESTPAWVMESNLPSAQFGFDVAGIGDLNHDGYADIAVSAPTADLAPFTPVDPMRIDAGLVWVFLGSATGPNPTTPDWTAEGSQPNTLFGSSLDGCGRREWQRLRRLGRGRSRLRRGSGGPGRSLSVLQRSGEPESDRRLVRHQQPTCFGLWSRSRRFGRCKRRRIR